MSEVTRENHHLNADRSTPPRVVNNNDADDLAEIDLVGLVTAVLRRWKLCAAICGVMMAAGLAYCFLVPTQYQTTSRVFVDVGQLKTTPKDEVQFVLSGKVLQKVFDDFKFGETKAFAGDAESMKHFRNLYDVKEVPKTALLEIAFKDPDVKRSAAVNAATAQGYINDVRDRVRQVLVNEQTVLQAVLDQREKERTEAIEALEAFKTKHGILSSDMESKGMENDLLMADGTSRSVRSGMTSLMYMTPSKVQIDSEKKESEQERLEKRLAQLDALAPEYQRLNGVHLAALAAYQRALSAVKESAAKIEGVNGGMLARVVVPPTDDESLVQKQPTKAKVMVIVVLVSLVLSVLICVVLELLDRTIKTRREFEWLSGLPVLAEVNLGKTDEVEKWRTVATLLDLGTTAEPKVFLTLKPSTVKTDISAAVQLAVAFAKSGKFVSLAVLNSDTVSTLMSLNGVQLKVDTEADFGACSGWTAEAGGAQFHVTNIPGERLTELLEATEEGDVVIVAESKPLTVSPEGLNVAAVDGIQTVVVGELRQTQRDALVDSLQRLDRVKANVVGAVMFE